MTLSRRELQVLGLLMFTDKQIAYRLGLCEETVRFYAKTLRAKLGVRTRTMAVVVAHRAGLIDLDTMEIP